MSHTEVKLKCLFVVNGLGLGNSTRCHAVIEHLAENGSTVHVLTSGNGLRYFEGKDCIASLTPMESLFYSGKNGGVSGWSTLKSLPLLARVSRQKGAQLEKVLESVRPEIAIIDSEYAVAPLRRRGIPIVGLNTSEMIVSEFLKCGDVPPGIRSHFWFVEFTDYLFHRHFCNLVLSPFPLRSTARHHKFRRVGLITRPALRDYIQPRAAFPQPRQLKRVLFMLSGSVHASNIRFQGREFPFKIDVVGRDGASGGNVTFHGRQMNNLKFLAGADALVINGGYSAVSEAFALRKPTFVIPVPGHAEQFVNARLVHELGLGFAATEADVLDQLLAMHQKDEWSGLKPMPPKFELDGARQAAHVIASCAGQVLDAEEQNDLPVWAKARGCRGIQPHSTRTRHSLR